MTTTFYSEEQAAAPKKVHTKTLLSLYAIIPVTFIFIGLDWALFDFQFRDHWLPKNPTDLVLWAIIFSFPHITSSFITLADKDYLKFYRGRLIKGLGIAGAFVLTANVLAPLVLADQQLERLAIVFFLTYATYTMYHLLSQQFGLGMMMMRAPRTSLFQVWRWSSTLVAVGVYILAYGGWLLGNRQITGMAMAQWIDYGIVFFLVGAIAFGLWQALYSQTQLGKQYLYANLAMLVAIYLALKLDYLIVAIIIPRFVHDITAFVIYSVHDHNRNRQQSHNLIYRALRFIPISPLLLCIPLAILVANGIECGFYLVDSALGFDTRGISECFFRKDYRTNDLNHLPASMALWAQVLFIASFFHYYLEGFVWRQDSIHRHAVNFKM